jgi:SAM-dependent methyltransferase
MFSCNACAFCGSDDYKTFRAQQFDYLQCEHCNSVAIVDTQIPIYDETYYSFVNERYGLNGVERFFLEKKGRLLYLLYPMLCGFTRRGLGPWTGLLSKGQNWLDYGAGNGLLTHVCDYHLESDNYFFDPYATSSSRKKIIEFSEAHAAKFDLITMSHCLEHSFTPVEDILQVSQLLASDGHLVIRVPVWSRFWGETRRNSWIQLDPPFHRHIPSVDGMRRLLLAKGFVVNQVIYDGTEFPWMKSFGTAGKLGKYKVFRYLLRLGQGLLNYVHFSDQAVFIARKKK